MKAWLLDSFTGLERLRLADAPDPSPGEGEVLMDVEYASLNPADRYLAEGQYPAQPPLPHILGRDGVGRVIALGAGVTGLSIGDAQAILRGPVGVSRAGTFAEKVVAPSDSLVAIPAGWTRQQAASAPLVYVTAYQALTAWQDLPPASVVLVTGASGGVGVASIHLGVAMGHTLVALSRDARKREELKKLGAAAALDPNDKQWGRALRDALGGRRVDLAIDNIGGPLFPAVIDTLGDRGRVSVVGRLAGAVPEFNTASLIFRRVRIGGVAVGAYTNAQSRDAWKEILTLSNRSGFRPLIDEVFTFDRLPQAFARLKEGPLGKVLLAVRPGAGSV